MPARNNQMILRPDNLQFNFDPQQQNGHFQPVFDENNFGARNMNDSVKLFLQKSDKHKLIAQVVFVLYSLVYW